MQLLKLHDRGQAVRMLQKLLNAAGYPLAVNGSFEADTARAVKAFQRKNKLTVDGIVYTQTWTGLLNKPLYELSEMPLLKKGSHGDAVKQLQQLLQKKGYAIKVDGVFDSVTEQAIMDFQQEYNLTVDGIVFTETWRALYRQTDLDPTALPLLQQGDSGEQVKRLQKLLNQQGYTLRVDGIFGPGTEQAVRDFQQQNKLSVDGVVYTQTWTALVPEKPSKERAKLYDKFLSPSDIQDFTQHYHLEEAVVKAVKQVESSGQGFLQNGLPKILFEGHIFWRQLEDRGYNPTRMWSGFENVLYAKWTKQYYKGGAGEWERLNKALSISADAAVAEAAYASASYGLFQIMGFHYRALGYAEIIRYVFEMRQSEKQQLFIFGKFLETNQLISYLQNHQWTAFARQYNGPGYAANAYHTKLEEAYEQIS